MKETLSFVFGLILIATATTAQAQTTYSINALGYVDANFVAGSNLVANPLFAGDNTISNLFRDVPDGGFFLPWDQGSKTFSPTNRFTLGGGWSDPSAVFLAPNGGFLWLPAATKISFVGQPWSFVPGPCVKYPAGESVFSWLGHGIRCLECDCTGDFEQEGNLVVTWSPHTQMYNDPTSYYDGLGWFPYEPILTVTESARFFAGYPTETLGPFRGLGNGITPHGLPWVDLRNPERSGTNLTFRWPSTSNVNYAVFCSTNLNTAFWQLVQEGTATPVNGVATISVSGTNNGAYYRVLPQFGGAIVLLGGARDGTNAFAFQLYAPVATNYLVQRTKTFPFTPNWQTITNVTGGPSNIVSVVDTAATVDTGYYRVLY